VEGVERVEVLTSRHVWKELDIPSECIIWESYMEMNGYFVY